MKISHSQMFENYLEKLLYQHHFSIVHYFLLMQIQINSYFFPLFDLFHYSIYYIPFLIHLIMTTGIICILRSIIIISFSYYHFYIQIFKKESLYFFFGNDFFLHFKNFRNY